MATISGVRVSRNERVTYRYDLYVDGNAAWVTFEFRDGEFHTYGWSGPKLKTEQVLWLQHWAAEEIEKIHDDQKLR